MVSIQLLPSACVDGDALTDEALVTVDELPVWDFAVDVATVGTDPDPCWAACCAAASTDAVGQKKWMLKSLSEIQVFLPLPFKLVVVIGTQFSTYYDPHFCFTHSNICCNGCPRTL